ncbi:MAG: AbrB/MazE/SpoVT family DNA-binding domain-containing protein [Candidatus Freyarchaeota archaeon]
MQLQENENQKFRKLQVTGRSSYILSLPKEWVEENGIKRGDTLAVQRDPDGFLRVAPLNSKSLLRETVNEIVVDNLSKEELEAMIIGNYSMGVNCFRLVTGRETFTLSQRKTVKNILRLLLGLRIVSESPTVIEVKSLLNPEDFNVWDELKRIGQLTNLLLRDLIQTLRERRSDVRDIIAQDEEIDRSYLLMRRLLTIGSRSVVVAKKIGVGSSDVCVVWSVIFKRMETLADYMVEMAKVITDIDYDKLPEEVFKAFLDICDYLLKRYEADLKPIEKAPHEFTPVELRPDRFEELKERLVEKEIEHSVDTRTLIALENICFYIKEIIRTLSEYLRAFTYYIQYLS